MEVINEVVEEVINYDLFITKISENGAILEYSLYEQNHNISIDNLARLIVTEDKDYCNYKAVNNELVELTEEEKQALIPTPTPSEEDKLQAQVTYTAMMTDTLLEV